MSLNSLQKNLLIASTFSIAMAYVESSVVVYLREILYPEGFHFPLKDIPIALFLTETGREIATIIMLWAFARSCGKNGREVFAYFIICFGIWDIWYYIWLKVLLHWPSTLLDWDILFLIPVPWLGPVLAPVLVSSAFIAAGIIIVKFESDKKPLVFKVQDWLFEIIAALIIIFSFLNQVDILKSHQMPHAFPWWIFISGFVLGLFVFTRRVFERSKKDG
jgi:hypothetical protein